MKRRFFLSLLMCAFGLFLAACGVSGASNGSPTTLPPTQPSPANNTNALACATQNHAPLDAFRPDPVIKLTASTKPKLVEFFAFW